MLDIKDLGSWLPQEAVKLYEDRGYRELYPPQAEAVEKGLMDGKSMLLAMPTASGKTLLAELAMLRAALQGRRCVYIVPLRALATEKYDSFKKFRDLGLAIGISTGDFDKRDERLGRNDIIIATSEKADSLMRNGASWVRDLGVLVVDEIHLLNDPGRGPTLEMTITKLRHLNPSLQVIGLSATVANAAELAGWLHAELVLSDWRPIRLREGVICNGRLVFLDGEAPLTAGGGPGSEGMEAAEAGFSAPGGKSPDSGAARAEKRASRAVSKSGPCKDEALTLVRDTLSQAAQILIFENSRKNAEAAAGRLCSLLPAHQEALDLSQSILATGESETAQRLASCVLRGVAFHHAGLLPEQRRLVEQGFRDAKIKVIASTPTLAAGLNLPARRVLIKSYKRYEYGRGMAPIPVIEYRQMAGRAGRPGLDPYGESFLLAKNDAEMEELFKHYINGTPEEIWSKLASESALRVHLLSTISAGFAQSEAELKAFIATTFYAQQQEPWNLDITIEKVLDFLRDNGMIQGSDGGDLVPTRLGSLVSRLYIDPLSAVIMLENLEKKKIASTEQAGGAFSSALDLARAARRTPSDLGLIHLITMTPDMGLLYVQSADAWIEEFIDQHQPELYDEDNYDYLLREAKTAAMLMDWIGEVNEEKIGSNYHIGPGDIRRLAETAEWLIHSLAELSKHQELGITFKTEQLAERIHYGAGPDLLALLSLKGIGRVRARKLHSSGITSMEKLKAAGQEQIARLLGSKIAEKVIAQLEKMQELEQPEGEPPRDSRQAKQMDLIGERSP
ncbi:MAG TPA: DEAD/DEAH box helicase [Methanothrix sp.]|nr:DEAD/DEAH box helicase [Methanothrix sp.]HPT19508.1 DEAD/DEAH box helicase [Methanothrix sp.]